MPLRVPVIDTCLYLPDIKILKIDDETIVCTKTYLFAYDPYYKCSSCKYDFYLNNKLEAI